MLIEDQSPNISKYYYSISLKVLKNILQYKLTRKSFINVNKIFTSKLKYIDYCYKGLSTKLFATNIKKLNKN